MKRQRDEKNEEDENKRRKIIIQLSDGVLSVVERVENDSGEVTPLKPWQPPTEPADVGEFTSLHLAVDDESLDVLESMLQSGADVNAVTKRKRTALHMAAENGRDDVANLLLQNGADVNAVDLYEEMEVMTTTMMTTTRMTTTSRVVFSTEACD